VSVGLLLQRRVDVQVNIEVSEKHTNYIFSAEDRDSIFLRNVGICLQVHTALQPKRLTSLSSQL
jgi:hypothetical protein